MNKEKRKIESRLVIAPQSAGRIGKSSVAEAIVEWGNFAGIEISVLDLDAEHLTISQRYPDIANIFPQAVKSDDGWQSLMLALDPPPAPLLIADVPAQITDHLLGQLIERKGLDTLESCGIRVTCLIFSAEDTAARQSAVRVVRELGNRVDWVVVHQPGPKPLIEDWEGSKLGQRLRELGAKELRLPRITRPTLATYEDLVKTEGRWFSLAAARKLVPTAVEFEIDFWRNAALTGCEDIAELLVADTDLIKQRVTRVGTPVGVGAKGIDLDF